LSKRIAPQKRNQQAINFSKSSIVAEEIKEERLLPEERASARASSKEKVEQEITEREKRSKRHQNVMKIVKVKFHKGKRFRAYTQRAAAAVTTKTTTTTERSASREC
jgi:hypothetical protein